jgi:hypothetical protein
LDENPPICNNPKQEIIAAGTKMWFSYSGLVIALVNSSMECSSCNGHWCDNHITPETNDNISSCYTKGTTSWLVGDFNMFLFPGMPKKIKDTEEKHDQQESYISNFASATSKTNFVTQDMLLHSLYGNEEDCEDELSNEDTNIKLIIGKQIDNFR